MEDFVFLPGQNAPLRQLSHLQIWEIWQAGKKGEPLSGEDARLYEVMEGHLQHARLWDRLNVATDAEINQGGVNLVLHLVFHTVIENQLAEDNPPAVRQVMQALIQKGLKEHDAAHALASVIAWEIYQMMRDNRPYDEQRYVRELRKLPLKVKERHPKKKK